MRKLKTNLNFEEFMKDVTDKFNQRSFLSMNM